MTAGHLGPEVEAHGLEDALAAVALAEGAEAVLLAAASAAAVAAAVAAAIAASTDAPACVCAGATGVVATEEAEVAPTGLDDVVRPESLSIPGALVAGRATGTVGIEEAGAVISGATALGDIENGVLVTACGAAARAAALAAPWVGAAACDRAGIDARDDGTCAVAASAAPTLLARAGRLAAVAETGDVDGGATAVAAGECAPDASIGRDAAGAG